MADLIALDTSFVLGLLDAKDVWHRSAKELQTVIASRGISPVAFDCVMAEVISTTARRFHEKRRAGELKQHLVHPRPVSQILDYMDL